MLPLRSWDFSFFISISEESPCKSKVKLGMTVEGHRNTVPSSEYKNKYICCYCIFLVYLQYLKRIQK